MKTRVSMVIMSHLSDTQEFISIGTNPDKDLAAIETINFVKWLVLKYPNTTVKIDPENEHERFIEETAYNHQPDKKDWEKI